MSIFGQLTEKPWLPDSDGGNGLDAGGGPFLPAPRVGLRVFLAVVSVLFFLLIIAYGGRMALEDWRPMPQPALLWQNTIMLTLASAAMHWAQYSARRDQIDGVKVGLFGAGAFTFAYVVGQAVAWQQLGTMDYFEITNPAIAMFYLITGLHVLHMLGGMVAWCKAVGRVWHRQESDDVLQIVEMCTTYWHYLLGVWLVLFFLLFTGRNFEILLEFCGLK